MKRSVRERCFSGWECQLFSYTFASYPSPLRSYELTLPLCSLVPFQAITVDFSISTFKRDALTSPLAQGQALGPTALAHVTPTMISGIHFDVNTKTTVRAGSLLRLPSLILPVKKPFGSLPDMHKSSTPSMDVSAMGATSVSLERAI